MFIFEKSYMASFKSKITKKSIVFLILNLLFWFIHWLIYLIIGYSRQLDVHLSYLTAQYVVPFFSVYFLRYFYNKYKIHRLHVAWIILTVFLTSIFCGFLFWIGMGSLNFMHTGTFHLGKFFSDIEPIWKSSYMFATWSAIFIGFKIFEDYTAQKQNAEKAASLAKQAQLEMLRYQLNPHFLFNTLSSLRALIRNKENNVAENMVTKISEFLKYSLLEGDANKVALSKEIKTIHHYFDIEKVRFGDQLEIEYSIDPETEEYSIPVFLIHPLIENAVKHGMKTSPSPLKITIETKVKNETLVIAVTNTGKWIEKENGDDSAGTGLQNTQKRLELAYPDNHHLEIIKNENSVQIRITINTKAGADEKTN